jgi:hypothetical protein
MADRKERLRTALALLSTAAQREFPADEYPAEHAACAELLYYIRGAIGAEGHTGELKLPRIGVWIECGIVSEVRTDTEGAVEVMIHDADLYETADEEERAEMEPIRKEIEALPVEIL